MRNVDCSVQKSERHVFEMGGKPTANNMHSSALVMRDEWPWPVVSSTTSTLPIGNFRAAPSVVKTSYSPRTVIKTIRRGAGCGLPPFQLGGAPIQKVGPSEIRNGAVCKGSAGGTANPEISSTLKSSKHGFPLASAKALRNALSSILTLRWSEHRRVSGRIHRVFGFGNYTLPVSTNGSCAVIPRRRRSQTHGRRREAP